MKLIICDIEITRIRNLRSILATIGHKGADIEALTEPRTAINTAKKKRFDAIFLSLELSKGSTEGLDILKQIREDRRLSTFPVILYSSEIHHDLLVQASALKVTSLLAYPFSVSDVENSLQLAMKAKKGL